MTVLALSGLAGCTSTDTAKSEPAAAPATASAEQRYDLKGKVLSVDKPGKMITVDHDAIPNFMAAMAMPYVVKDEKILDTVAPGDQITAKVVTGGASGYWLENVIVTEKGAKD